MIKLVRLASILLLLTFANFTFVQSQSPIDLNGKTLEFTSNTGPLAREAKQAKLREFIWQSWTNKRKAVVSTSHFGIDGFPKVTEIRVKKDHKGKWYVEVATSVRYGFLGLRKAVIESVKSYSVDRVATITYEGSVEIPSKIKPGENPDPKLYCVRLRINDGSGDFIF